MTQTQPAPPVPAGVPATPSGRRPWWRRARVLAPVALLLGIGIGSAGHASPTTTASSTTGSTAAATTATAETATTTETVTDTATATTTQTVKAAPPKPAAPTAAITDDGTYLVGSEIKPGTYRSPGGDACYWARLRDTSGGMNSIIANGLGGGKQVVTIRASDKAFETRDCGNWTRL